MRGLVAQLVEHHDGIVGVRSSSLLKSTQNKIISSNKGAKL